MKFIIFGLFLALASACAQPSSIGSAISDSTRLGPGRYRIALSGLVCHVCARAVTDAWTALPQVESALIDFDNESALIAVRPDAELKIKTLRKALRQAEQMANLGATYAIIDVGPAPQAH